MITSKNKHAFVPNFPMKISNVVQRVHYRKTSMFLAIEHFKTQLGKLQMRKKRNISNDQEKTPSRSIKYLSLSTCLIEPNLNQASPGSKANFEDLPKKILPPIKTHKKIIFAEKNLGIMCISSRAPLISQKKKPAKVLKLSKSHKIQQLASPQVAKSTKRKPIELKKDFKMPEESSSSSPSPIWDSHF